MAAVDERFGEVDLPARMKISCDRGEDLVEHALALPLLKPTEARRVRRVATRHVRPRRTGAKHPEDPVQNVARIAPRSTALFSRSLPLWPRHELPNRLPLLVLQVHPKGTNIFHGPWK